MADEDPFAFDPAKCDLGEVPAIPEGEMLADDSVDPPPPAIADCLAAPVTPLSPEPPCPEIRVVAAEYNYGEEVAAPLIEFTVTPQACCVFDVALRLDVPLPGCPVITPTDPLGHPVTFTDGAGTATMLVTKDALAACTFDLDLDVQVHCTDLASLTDGAPVGFAGGPLGTATLAITRVGECDYQFALDLEAPCPPVSGGGGPAPIGYSNATGTAGTITLAVAQDPGCATTISVDAELECPPITVAGAASVHKPVGFTTGTGGITLSATQGDGCAFDLDVDLDVPCPGLHTLPATAIFWDTGSVAGTAGLGFFREEFSESAGGTSCDYTLGVDVSLHCPILAVPAGSASLSGSLSASESGGIAEVVVGYNDDVVGHFRLVVTPGDHCDYVLDIAGSIPCPPVTVSGGLYHIGKRVTVAYTDDRTPAGSGTLSITATPGPDCNHDLDVDLDLEINCPPIVSLADRKPVMFAAPGDPAEVTLTVVPGDGCSYAIDVDLTIPDVSGLCPTLTSLAVGKPISVAAGNPATATLSITANPASASLSGGVAAVPCEYFFDLDVSLPCPQLHSLAHKKPAKASPDGLATITLQVLKNPGEAGGSDSLSDSYSQSASGQDGCEVFYIDADLELPTGLSGLVTGGSGNLWTVDLYGDGPGHAQTTAGATVHVRNVGTTATVFVPVGLWIGPIFLVDDVYYWVAPVSGLIGLTSTSISGRSGATPGSGTATVYSFDGATLVSLGSYTVFTTSHVATPTATYVQLKLVNGYLFVDAEDCP